MANKPLISYLESIDDPRQQEKCTYVLSEIVFMAICAIFCGQENWEQVALYCEEREEWFKKWFELPDGIPSHDTFNRLFSIMPPEVMQKVFREWVQDFLEHSPIKGQIEIDGKALRGAAKGKGAKTIHMVNAWASEHGICLAQRKVDDKSNEITAIPELLDLLDINGCLVSIDAMGTQKKIAKKILTGGADYFLSVKGNQKKLATEVNEVFDNYWLAQSVDCENIVFTEGFDEGHGRKEHRRCWVLPVTDETPLSASWNAESLVAVQSDRTNGDKFSSSIRFYICSRGLTAEEALRASRSHWSVENHLHWALDVSFGEDESRARQGYSGENLAVLRQLVLNILRQNTSRKLSLKNKRTLCVLNDDYLLQCLKMVK